MKYCSIELCGIKHFAKGLCSRHYYHNKKYGLKYSSSYNRHGMTNHPYYGSYKSMKARCYNKNYVEYPNYGARGIRVCDRWLDNLKNFIEDMGERPKGYTLDRIDVNGDYTPENCRWASLSTQNANRRYSSGKWGYKGVQKKGSRYHCSFDYLCKNYTIYSFDTAEESAYVYDQIILQLHGDNVPLNFLGNNPRYI